MKKKMKKSLVCIIALFYLPTLAGLAQNPILSIPNNYYNINVGVFPLPLLFSPYTDNHNAYPAPDGSLGFYVVDEYVYDGNGDLVGAMWLPTAVELL